MLQSAALKPKTCAMCPKQFLPRSSFATCCSQRCAMRKVKRDNSEKAAKEKAELKARKAAIQTIPELIKSADRAFAAYIRERDRQAGFPCISSGKPLDWSGNQVDAGHYRSRGAASHLRYDEDNCHAQSKYENRYRAGNAVSYRVHLINRIGLERVETLEANNEPKKWTRERLLVVCFTYSTKLKELKERQET